jgi:hypothetical protein
MPKQKTSNLSPELAARLKQQPSEEVEFTPRSAQPLLPPEVARQRRRRGWRGKTCPPSVEIFAWLDEKYLADAKAGATDEDLVRWSGVALHTIVRWRRSRGIVRRPGQNGRCARALNLLGVEHGDVLHRCDDSPLGGLWEVPEYVLRHPLHYGELLRHLWFLYQRLGSTPRVLAEAFGIREQDVQTALALWEAFLAKNGKPCERCGISVVSADRYCSVFCWRIIEGEP